jgi:phenylacetate-CoA ligase
MIGPHLFRLTHQLRGTRTLQLLDEIRDSPFQSDPRELQMRLLRNLLTHAAARVPYYRDLFASLGVRADDIRTMADYARLPILTKDIIRGEGDRMLRDDVDKKTLQPHFSGGSTGVPLSFFREPIYMDRSDAGTYRNLMQCGWKPGEMVAFFWGFNEKHAAMSGLEFEMRQRLRRFYQFDPFQSGPSEMDTWIAKWDSIAPKVLLGYASTVARFARHVEDRGVRMAPLKGVYTTAEKLYQPQREQIARVFQCTVFDSYGSSEVQNIACECPKGKMHVNADFVIVEPHPDTPPGTVGPLILTSLWNYAMPFLRYRNEDAAALSPDACACGNRFPVMRLEVSRVSDNFVFPGGKVVHGEFFTHLMYGSDGVASFQFHQTSMHEITLSIVPGPGSESGRKAAIDKAMAEVEKLAPGVVRWTIREVDEIPLSRAGKHRFTRSDVVS